jgi:hypothetical protein
MKPKRNTYLDLLILFYIFISIFSSCSNLESEKNVISKNHKKLEVKDTIKVSDSLSLIINRAPMGNIIIESLDRNNNKFCEIDLYKNGSLKSLQNIKGERIDKIDEGTWQTILYNIQVVKLDLNGFIEHYVLTRNFKVIAYANYLDSLKGK